MRAERKAREATIEADGDVLAVAATKGGQPTHPAWFHNLKANPDAEVEIRGERRRVRARILEGDERARRWHAMNDQYGGFEHYGARTSREFAMLIRSTLVNMSSGSVDLRL